MRTSHTPGLRSRIDPVPCFDQFAADARSLQLARIPIAIGIVIGMAQDLGAVTVPGQRCCLRLRWRALLDLNP